MTDRPRIAIVLPSLAGGGAERVCLLLGEAFAARGFAVDLVVLRARGEFAQAVPDGIVVHDLAVRRFAHALTPLRTYFRTARPDATLVAMWPLTSIAVVAHRLAGRPGRLVLSDHTTLSKAYDDKGAGHRLRMTGSIALTYRLADACVAVSGGVADDLARLSGIARHRFTAIHNPIQLSTDPVEAPARQPGKGAHILSVGSLRRAKNQALLIRAFARFAADRDASLTILGEGPLRGELELLIRQLGLGDRVRMPGFIDDPTPFYRSADLFAFSSDYEGFGNVIVEALANGLPVVSTDCPNGPAEILEGGRFGMLVPCGDAGALADAMAASLAAPHDAAALKARAEVFRPGNAAEAYLQLLFPKRAAA